MITLVYADAYPIVRVGIRAILADTPDIQILGEAEKSDEVQSLVADLRPKILLLDLEMPGLNPITLIRWVHTNYPDTAALVLTDQGFDAYLAAMLDVGAAGLLGMNTTAEQLITAIRRVAQGENLFDRNS